MEFTAGKHQSEVTCALRSSHSAGQEAAAQILQSQGDRVHFDLRFI